MYGPLHAQPKYHTPITLPANQDGTDFTLTIPNHVPPGTYSFLVSGLGTVNYARSPEQLQAAETRLVAIEKIVAANDVRLKAALAAKAAAAKALADMQAAKQDTKAAIAARTAAEKTAAEADRKAKEDAAFLQTYRLEVSKLRDQSKATDLKISAASTRVTLKITPAPFELKLAPATVSVKPGTRIELPVTIQRLYGFADPVQVQFSAANVAGLSPAPIAIAAGKTDGRIVIEAPVNAPPGTYAATMQATATYMVNH